MSSKDAQAKARELRNFFKGNKHYLGNAPNKKQKDEFSLTQLAEFEISEKSAINVRVKALKELSEKVLNQQLEDFALEKLCRCTEDILKSSSKEHRYTVLQFFQCLVQGQYNHLGPMRCYFFNVVTSTEYKDDVIPKFELFKILTDNGKDLLYFEEKVGHFLVDWTPVIVAAGKTTEFLKILVNYIKYNAAYTDDEIINGIVQYIAYFCCQSDIEEVVKGSLNVLDAIVCYSNISQQTMPVFISALNRTVCLDSYNAASCKAAECRVPVIMMEVCACIKWMIEKYGKELKDPLWDKIFDILETLLCNIDKAPNKAEFQKSVLDLFSKIDALLESNQFKGDTSNFYRLVFDWYPMATESLVERLIDYKVRFSIPIEDDWIVNLQCLVQNFFRERNTYTCTHSYVE